VMFLLVGGVVLAQEQTETTTTVPETTSTTVVLETTTTLASKPVAMPFSFTVNKWFLQFRKAVTTNPVQKAKLDTQILEKEEKAINKLIETNRIVITDKLVTNYIQKKENITNQLEQLKKDGQNVDTLINNVKNGTVEQGTPLAKRLENASDEDKAKIIANLENHKENIQKRIEVKEGVLQNAKTDEELKALKSQVVLNAEEHKAIFNQLVELVKDKVLLLNEVQKEHFHNFLRSKIARLTKEGLEKMKQQIADGSIKVELENIIAKIVANPKPIINPEKKAVIEERKDLNTEIREDKKGVLDATKEKIQDLRDIKIKTLTPEEKQKLIDDAKKVRQEGIDQLKALNEEKNKRLEELKNKMQNLPKPPLPSKPMMPNTTTSPTSTPSTGIN
jgi:hypothetical protein